MPMTNRAMPHPASCVALETTLLVHGVPRQTAPGLARKLDELVQSQQVRPCLVGVVRGVPTVGMTRTELFQLLDATDVPKVNTGNLGIAIHRSQHAATTVSATMELAAAAGVRVFATGGIGGIHHALADRLDISADLSALARFPVAVVASGVKGLLDIVSTREALETLGVPVVGFGTDRFPAFYQRDGGIDIDGRFDDPRDLARFVRDELERTGRGVLVCNPIPESDEIAPDDWAPWLDQAERSARDSGATGRAVTPAILAVLHEVSQGATLRANLALVLSNTALAARLCREMVLLDPGGSVFLNSGD